MTLFIIILTVVVSITAFQKPELFEKLKFNAYYIKSKNEGFRFLSYGLIHADYFHLGINMFVLYSFGDIVEHFFKEYFDGMAGVYFMLLYITSIIISVIASFIKNRDNIYYNAVGASGAVSAIVFASILLYPIGKIYLFFIPIPISSPIFGIIYLAYSYYMAKRAKDNIGHDAHFWGAVYGFIFPVVLKPELFKIFIINLF